MHQTHLLPSASRLLISCLLLFALLLSACGTATEAPTVTPVGYNPFVPLDGSSPVIVPTSADVTTVPGQPTPTEMPFIVPTAIPLEQLLPTSRSRRWPFQPIPEL